MTGAERALDRFQPMYRVNLVVWTAIGTAGVVLSVLTGMWPLALLMAGLALVSRICVDQLLLCWCLYREYPTWTPEQRRDGYNREFT